MAGPGGSWVGGPLLPPFGLLPFRAVGLRAHDSASLCSLALLSAAPLVARGKQKQNYTTLHYPKSCRFHLHLCALCTIVRVLGCWHAGSGLCSITAVRIVHCGRDHLHANTVLSCAPIYLANITCSSAIYLGLSTLSDPIAGLTRCQVSQDCELSATTQ